MSRVRRREAMLDNDPGAHFSDRKHVLFVLLLKIHAIDVCLFVPVLPPSLFGLLHYFRIEFIDSHRERRV